VSYLGGPANAAASRPRAPGVARAGSGSVAHAVAWAGGAKWLTQLVNWASTILVVRLLTPEDFGLVGMAQIFASLVMIFTEFGLATAIIAHPELAEEQIGQLNTLSVIAGMVAVLIMCAAAAPLGRFFTAPQLPLVVMAISSIFAINGFRIVPNAVLQRELRFRYLAIAESIPSIVGAVAMIGFAALGFHYWTLVIGAVLGSVVATVLTVMGRPCRLLWPQLTLEISSVLKVSWHLLATRFVWWVQVNADGLVIGRFLGKGPLGAYAMTMSVASLPLDKITSLVTQVSPPFLSAAQTNRLALRKMLLVLTGVLAVAVFPIAAGLTVVAPAFVLTILGPKWETVTPALRLLSTAAAFRSVKSLLAPVVVITGGTRLFMYLGFIEAAIMSLTFYIGSGFGITGVALGWLLVYPILQTPIYVWVFRRTGVRLTEYLSILWPALRATVLMVAAVTGLNLIMPVDWPALQRLIAQVGLGVATYILISLLQRRRLHAMYREFRALGLPTAPSQLLESSPPASFAWIRGRVRWLPGALRRGQGWGARE
jgi:O-antigen/teichoic acid export membrane protein